MKTHIMLLMAISALWVTTSSKAINQSLEVCKAEKDNRAVHQEVCQALNEHPSPPSSDGQDLMGLAALGSLSLFKDYDESKFANLGVDVSSVKLMIPMALPMLFPNREAVFKLEPLLNKLSSFASLSVSAMQDTIGLKQHKLQKMLASYWLILKRATHSTQYDESYSSQRIFSNVITQRLKKSNLSGTSKCLEWVVACEDGFSVLFTCPYTGKQDSQAAAPLTKAQPMVGGAQYPLFEEKDRAHGFEVGSMF